MGNIHSTPIHVQTFIPIVPLQSIYIRCYHNVSLRVLTCNMAKMNIKLSFDEIMVHANFPNIWYNLKPNHTARSLYSPSLCLYPPYLTSHLKWNYYSTTHDSRTKT